MLTLACDPGVKHLAWALAAEDRLIGCDLIKNQEGLKDHALGYFYSHQLPNSHKTVIERSHFFKGESIYILQDLLDVNIVAGWVAGARNGTLISVAKWRRGQVPKKVQANRTFKRLTIEEKRLLGVNVKTVDDVDHNIMDAVGILMSVVGRLDNE